jgi:hypothetical protein
MDRQAEGHRSGAHPRPVGAVHRYGAATRTWVRRALGSSRRVPEAGFEPASPFGQMGLSHPCMPFQHSGLSVEEGTEMRSRAEVADVLELVGTGWNDSQIACETGIPRRTVRDWRNGRTPDFDRVRRRLDDRSRSCAVCGGEPLSLPLPAYTYLLGLYLGDGYIAFSNVSADIRGSSGGPATSWGSSGGRTTRSACRWPGGGASPCWTGSWGRNGEAGRSNPSLLPDLRGRRVRSDPVGQAAACGPCSAVATRVRATRLPSSKNPVLVLARVITASAAASPISNRALVLTLLMVSQAWW